MNLCIWKFGINVDGKFKLVQCIENSVYCTWFLVLFSFWFNIGSKGAIFMAKWESGLSVDCFPNHFSIMSISKVGLFCRFPN